MSSLFQTQSRGDRPNLQHSLTAWSLETIASHIGDRELTADMMNSSGSRASSEAWSFRRWAAAASAWTAKIDTPVPYIRNVVLPERLRQECAHLSPFPARSLTLFLGCRGSRSRHS